MRILAFDPEGTGSVHAALIALDKVWVDIERTKNIDKDVRTYHAAYDGIVVWGGHHNDPVEMVKRVHSALPDRLDKPKYKINKAIFVILPQKYNKRAFACIEAGAYIAFKTPSHCTNIVQQMREAIHDDLDCYICGNFMATEQRIYYKNFELTLETDEWEMLRALMRSRDTLLDHAFFTSFFKWTPNHLDAVFTSLQRKIVALGARRNLIHEVPGYGYLITRDLRKSARVDTMPLSNQR